MKTDSSDENATSHTQYILLKLDAFDKWVSSFVFRLSLPPIVEAIYSVPANFFGLVPSLAIGPLWVALLTLQYDDSINQSTYYRLEQHKIGLLKDITILLTILFLGAWFLFQKGYMPLKRIMARGILYLVSILSNIALLSYTLLQFPSEDPYAIVTNRAFSHSIYILFLWPLSILVIVILKESSQRIRPVAIDMAKNDNEDRWINRKSFPNICYFLAKAQANESFPSGDATSAAIFAIVLVNIHPKYTLPAWSLLLLACSGRMYFLAHHFFDVLVGSLVAVCIHRVASFGGLGIYDMEWWHPLASMACLAFYFKTFTKNKHKIG